MLLSALSFLVVAQSSSKVPEGLMNNPVYVSTTTLLLKQKQHSTRKIIFTSKLDFYLRKKLVKCYIWGLGLCVLKLEHFGK